MESNVNTICVVEDNNSIRKLFCTLLKKAGYQTVDFANGNSALQWLHSNQTQAIILDILLPDLNGTDVLKEIRNLSNGQKIPVIAVTGFAHGNDKKHFLDIGFDHYISKPINIATYIKEVEETIKNKK